MKNGFLSQCSAKEIYLRSRGENILTDLLVKHRFVYLIFMIAKKKIPKRKIIKAEISKILSDLFFIK